MGSRIATRKDFDYLQKAGEGASGHMVVVCCRPGMKAPVCSFIAETEGRHSNEKQRGTAAAVNRAEEGQWSAGLRGTTTKAIAPALKKFAHLTII